MKTFTTIMKILAVLAAIAGVVYVVATFGDRIVAWAKDLLAKLKGNCCCCDEDCCCDDECCCEEVAEEADFAG